MTRLHNSEPGELGGIVLGELMGRGATGRVYRGTTADGDTVAVKVLREELAEDPLVLGRLVQECNILASLSGPHVVPVRRLVVENGQVAVVMDCLTGGDVRGLLRREGNLPPGRAGALLEDVLEALAQAHALGVLHRDVKPENVLLDGAGSARLTDFGIAVVLEGPTTTRGTGLVGAPDYMAPELSGRTTPTPAVDVYAAGCMFYELLTGTSPFAGGAAAAVLLRHLQEPPARPPGLPDPLWGLLDRMLAKEPHVRPAAPVAAQELVALRPLLAALPAGARLLQPYDQDGTGLQDVTAKTSGGRPDEGTRETQFRPVKPRPAPGALDAASPSTTKRSSSAKGRRAALVLVPAVLAGVLAGGAVLMHGRERPAASDPLAVAAAAGGVLPVPAATTDPSSVAPSDPASAEPSQPAVVAGGAGRTPAANFPDGAATVTAPTAGPAPAPPVARAVGTVGTPAPRPEPSRKPRPPSVPEPVAPRILGAVPPDATVGRPYRAPMTAVGGRPPYNWTLLAGRVPGGLELQPDGSVTGTPGEAYSGNFTVRVRDAAGLTATAKRSLTSVLLRGDTNRDGQVDCEDLSRLRADYDGGKGSSAGSPADVDGDGGVDARDASIMMSNWTGTGGACPGG